jgi:arylsulfatase A-like enzyme
VFTSDNGFNGLQSTNNRLRGAKGSVYEGGIRVPALIYWPNKTNKSKIDIPISGLDYFPTFLDWAGVSNFKEVLDGESLVPLLQQQAFNKEPLFWHIASSYKSPPSSIIRKGKWKLIQNLLDGSVELYNLEQDLKESNNLATQEFSVKDALLNELVQWRKKHKAPLPEVSILKN